MASTPVDSLIRDFYEYLVAHGHYDLLYELRLYQERHRSKPLPSYSVLANLLADAPVDNSSFMKEYAALGWLPGPHKLVSAPEGVEAWAKDPFLFNDDSVVGSMTKTRRTTYDSPPAAEPVMSQALLNVDKSKAVLVVDGTTYCEAERVPIKFGNVDIGAGRAIYRIPASAFKWAQYTGGMARVKRSARLEFSNTLKNEHISIMYDTEDSLEMAFAVANYKAGINLFLEDPAVREIKTVIVHVDTYPVYWCKFH